MRKPRIVPATRPPVSKTDERSDLGQLQRDSDRKVREFFDRQQRDPKVGPSGRRRTA